jgi:hypothetical protein
MKFMLILNSPRHGYTEYAKWPKKVLDAHGAFMQKFTQRLKEKGELVLAAGLASPEQALLVRAGSDGTPVTDGIFPESKEYLAGWWIIDVESKERAIALAAEATTAPGIPATGVDGKVMEHEWVEVRQMMGSSADIA